MNKTEQGLKRGRKSNKQQFRRTKNPNENRKQRPKLPNLYNFALAEQNHNPTQSQVNPHTVPAHVSVCVCVCGACTTTTQSNITSVRQHAVAGENRKRRKIPNVLMIMLDIPCKQQAE